jgi:HAD superfamily hydrolase (TIGR01509 family)
MDAAPALQAVLFDWRGILVHDPPHEWWVAQALVGVGRPASDDAVASFSDALRAGASHPEVVEGEKTCDCSAQAHRAWSLRFFELAGFDAELAESLYALDFEATSHPFYSDVAGVFAELQRRGVRIAVVSDIHVDLRPEFVAAGLNQHVDAYVLSFEHGVQKPDREIFEIALRMLDVAPHAALMVGDRASHDGGAVAAGITTLLLPAVASADNPVGLERVLALVR